MTDADRWRRVEAVFAEAADLAPADRSRYLDDACRVPGGGADAALRAEVEALLALDLEAAAFFDDAHDHLASVAGRLADPAAEAGPERVGAWRLVREVGRGGMGTVHLAARADGRFEQTAAVKLVRTGLAPDLVARFRAERQILARLDHPAIARLLDGGRTDDGRPYLVMEYVDGEPITAYCDRRRLSVNERLALFRTVCEAVQFAHQHLVVHRDLKPSNVLVAEGADGQPRVKLLDFGIAKLLAEAADGPSPVETQPDQRVMTPEYAAPEQVRGEPVSTATDVYALGVLLYELLTGRRPHAHASGRHAVERAILDTEPVRPSEAVTVRVTAGGRVPSDPSQPEPAADAFAGDTGVLRATTADRLRRRLRGDLDRIVLKALRKEPQRRYDGAAALAADVRRHLDGLPVQARRDTLAYRASKFVRRHRAGVAVAALVVVWGLGAAAVRAIERVVPTAAFADRVVQVETGGDYIRPANADPSTALGPPDSEPSRPGRNVALGSGGTLVVAFDDNVLIDGPGDDLAVYEAVTSDEQVAVAISEDGRTFVEVGHLHGAQGTFDIRPVARPGARYRYVRLVDLPLRHSGTGLAPGADIDAVGALHSAFAGWKRPLGWLGFRPRVDHYPGAGTAYTPVEVAVAYREMTERSERLGEWHGMELGALALAAQLDALPRTRHDALPARRLEVAQRCLLGRARFRLGRRAQAEPLLRACAAEVPALFEPGSDPAVRARLALTLLDDPAATADRVVRHEPGPFPPSARSPAWRPDLALGPPDYVAFGPAAAFPLAPGGALVVAFDDNVLVDGPGPDLVVVTAGLRTPRIDVAVSEDGQTWTDLEPDWELGVFDLGPLMPPGARVRYVRVAHGWAEPARDRIGLVVDAVVALASRPR